MAPWSSLARAEEGFTQSIPPEEFKAAGLNRLTADERKHLDELIFAYKNGLVVAARRSEEEALKAKQAAEAETRTAKTEAAAKAAKAEAEIKAAKAEAVEAKGGSPGFWARAKVKLVPGTQIEYAEIKAVIEGSFEGWQGHSVFRLNNGQRWQVVNDGESYFTPPIKNVEVEIRPSAFGVFGCIYPTLHTRVRVKLVGDK
ncbi:MAG: hypothetical protein WDM96_17345 [Lacunisphaera sp.]